MLEFPAIDGTAKYKVLTSESKNPFTGVSKILNVVQIDRQSVREKAFMNHNE